ncbi:MAG: AAA family ATPase [Gammaproteobacteria bacterium]|nr:AAA family ATPase [Gammaproteobacteria bacterium]
MASGTMQHGLPPLISALTGTAPWSHPVGDIEIVQTHISWVLLTGDYAYKLKRALDLGFLDFSTLEKRRDACFEEVRLNRRTASGLYCDVVAICGTAEKPRVVAIDEAGDDILEYAVRMKQFPQQDRLDIAIADDRLELRDMDRLATHVAGFHESIPRAHPDDPWNGVDWIARLCRDNFETLTPLVDDARETDTLEHLRGWTDEQLDFLAPTIERRHRDGHVRECHGDLHLSNLVWLGDSFAAFDCIEFDPALRWMDVASEIGFLVMDLATRQRTDLAWRFLNRYLEITGDYDATRTLRLYIVYASMVRAKIAGLRAEEEADGKARYMQQARSYRSHLGLAERATRPRRPLLLLTHGLSASGKTWLSSQLACVLPAVRVVSDIERKRLHGLAASERTDSGLDEGIYDEQSSAATADRLAECATSILTGEFDCIVDATFLDHDKRQRFIRLGRELGAEPLILDCVARESTLRERITQRAWDGADPSEADWSVLQKQIASAEPLTAEERRCALTVDDSEPIDVLRTAGAIWQKLGRTTD